MMTFWRSLLALALTAQGSASAISGECPAAGCSGGEAQPPQQQPQQQPAEPEDSSSLMQAHRARQARKAKVGLHGAASHPEGYRRTMKGPALKHFLHGLGSKAGACTSLDGCVTADGIKVAEGCFMPDPSNPQKVWWGYHCSINNSPDEPFYYVNYLAKSGPKFDKAMRGEIIAVGCDDVFCPPPYVQDCYYSPGICEENVSFCFYKEHEKFGDWGISSYNGYSNDVNHNSKRDSLGYTNPNGYCKHDINQTIDDGSVTSTNGINASQVQASYASWCPPMAQTVANEEVVWRPIQAQCVKYRQEWQSCISDVLSYPNKMLDPDMPMSKSTGQPFERPLVCAPNLLCTGDDYKVLPNTCIKPRPKDECFYGSWWDSTECPRKQSNLPGGLEWGQFVEALKQAIITYPGEIAFQGDCLYWSNFTSEPRGMNAEKARKTLYEIVGTLWPSHVFPPPPSYEALMAMLPNPYTNCSCIKTPSDCENAANEDNETPNCVQTNLKMAAKLSMQPNKLWSVAHFLVHNLQDPVPEEQANAAQALAAFLGQKFTCNDCRGFFEGVVKVYGLPPITTSSADIARWYWYGHNVVSEHVATTRGTHPWLIQLGDQNTIETPKNWTTQSLQNPWFMPWSVALKQWTSPWKLETLESTECDTGSRGTVPRGLARAAATSTELSLGECLDLCVTDASCSGFNYVGKCNFFSGKVLAMQDLDSTCYKIIRKSSSV